MRNALRSAPRLVALAGEFRLVVAFPVVALVPCVLVRIVQTIVVAVAYIYARDAMAVIAGEQIAKAGSPFALAVLEGFITPISTIIVPVTVPSRWDTTVIGTSEAILRTGGFGTVNRILVGIISAVVVAIAEPIRFNADVCLLAFQVTRGARRVPWTPFVRFIRCRVVFTIIYSVTYLRHGDTALVITGEFTGGAGRVVTVQFVRAVLAVVFVITFPRAEDASPVVATELARVTRVKHAVFDIFVAVVSTIIISVAGPHPRNALPVGAIEFVRFACQVSCDAHPPIVDQLCVLVTFAFGFARWSGVAALGASSIADVAGIDLALLSVQREDVDVPR